MLKPGDQVRHRTEEGYGVGQVQAAMLGQAVVHWPILQDRHGFTEDEATGVYPVENLVGEDQA